LRNFQILRFLGRNLKKIFEKEFWIIRQLLQGTPAVVEAANDNNPENPGNKLEETRAKLNKIIDFINNNEESPSASISPIQKSFKFSNGNTVSIGLTKFGYVMLTTEDGREIYLDNDADGLVDRIVINGQEDENDKQNNNSYIFSPMDDLAEEADAATSLNPKNVKILAIDHDGNKVEIIDMSEGAGVLSGGYDTSFIDKLQTKYSLEVEEISQEISQ